MGTRHGGASMVDDPARRAVDGHCVALRYADFGYILENGRVVMEGEASEMANNEAVKEFYLDVSGAGRTSFCSMKCYRRRKRWLA